MSSNSINKQSSEPASANVSESELLKPEDVADEPKETIISHDEEEEDESTEPCRSNSDDDSQQEQQQQQQQEAAPKQPIEFVADDFVARIRAASQVKSSISGSSISSWASSSNYGGGCAGGPGGNVGGVGVSRSTSYPIGLLAQVSPDDIPEIDPHALADLETHARRLSDQLIHLTASLRAGLQAACGITAQHSRLHKQSVDAACDTVETAIRHMYALMARCEEVAAAMTGVHQLKHDVENVKRILDRLEASL